jgi:hypothetical protein
MTSVANTWRANGVADGTAVWASEAWLFDAVRWIDDRLAETGRERRAVVEQTHLRPWATVLRVPTDRGDVWFKAAGAGTAFEVALYEVLARTVPDQVLVPIALDVTRSWVLLPDGGRPIGERLEGQPLVTALVTALEQYARLQQALTPRVDELLALGVVDMRPEMMPRRFAEALRATASTLDGATDAEREAHARVVALRPTFERWCERLADSALPSSLDHNDLHPWNILGGTAPGESIRFFDWGDAVVAHPFAAMLVPLGFVQRLLGVDIDDPSFLRARDTYLDVHAPMAPGEDLAATLAVACRVAKAARVLTWHRAVSAARAGGDEVDEYYAQAPLATLTSLLDDAYLGGA